MADEITDLDLAAAELAAPSSSLVKSVLSRTIPRGEGYSLILKEWRALLKSRPTIAQFIAATAYRMEPKNPQARQYIAIAMIRLYILMSEASLHEDIEKLFGQSLKQLFPPAA